MPSGTYTISVTAPSFRTAALSNVVVTVNTQVRADIVMQVGDVNEKVEVKDTTPQLQTNTAAHGRRYRQPDHPRIAAEQPQFLRPCGANPLRTVGTSSVMDSRSIDIGGIRNTSTGANLDGVDFTVVNQNNPAIALSLDALSEFKVVANFMDAAYGHGTAFLDMVTK